MNKDKADFAHIRNSEELEPFIDQLTLAADKELSGENAATFLRHVQAVLRAPQEAGLPDEDVPSWPWMAQLLAASYQRMKAAK